MDQPFLAGLFTDHGLHFHKVQRAMFIGGGRGHRVENNIFVDCLPAAQVDGRGLDRSPIRARMVDETMRRGLEEVPADLYRRRYPEIGGLDRYYTARDGKGAPPEKMDFRIRKALSIWKTGFKAIPVERIGLRKNGLRRELEKMRAGKN